MAYEKNTWASGDVVTSAKLNNMENGIGNAGCNATLFFTAEGFDGSCTLGAVAYAVYFDENWWAYERESDTWIIPTIGGSGSPDDYSTFPPIFPCLSIPASEAAAPFLICYNGIIAESEDGILGEETEFVVDSETGYRAYRITGGGTITFKPES